VKLTHLCIVTGDLQRLARFYREVLQVEPEFYGNEYVEFPLGEGSATLSLYSLESHERLAPGTMEAGLNRSLELEFQVADVDREYARLQGVASQWLMPPTDLPWGHRSIYFRDPDGNFLNFYSLIQD